MAAVNPLLQDQTEAAGLVFQHYAYASEEQVRFKQDYYGYGGSVDRWKALQQQTHWPVRVRDFFPWFAYESNAERAGERLPPQLVDLDQLANATYLPPMRARDEVRHIAFMRTDAIGDNVLASVMLPHLRQAYPNAKITVVTQESAAPLYEACPLVDGVIPCHRLKGYEDVPYREQLAAQVKALEADLCLNSVYSVSRSTTFSQASGVDRSPFAAT